MLHLAERRLLTLSGAEGSERKVDIAHETLITSWPTLQTWLSERREAEQDRRRLEARVADWVRRGRGRNGLLDELELAEAARWLASSDAVELGYDETLPALVEASQAAIEESQRAKEAAQQQVLDQAQALAETERQRAEAQSRAVRSLRALVVVLSLLVLVSGAALARPAWLRQRAIWLSPVTAIPIPDGTAMIGSDDPWAAATSRPAHRVKLPPFEIDTHEVTNRQYCLCRSAGGCGNDPTYDTYRVCDSTIADDPVTNVTLMQASEYCTWIGRRLPTEIEWEWTARGPEQRRYPTGNEQPNAGSVNLRDPEVQGRDRTVWPVGAATADRTPDNGVMDMAGNVQEWTVSLYLGYDHPNVHTVYWPQQVADAGNQLPSGVVVRGGSWYTRAEGADATRRYPLLANQAYDYLGFRCLTGLPLEQIK